MVNTCAIDLNALNSFQHCYVTDPNVILYSIILSGLLSMSVMKDIQRKTCGFQMPRAMRNQVFQEMP